jgi:nitrite reductase (NADH) small subunit
MSLQIELITRLAGPAEICLGPIEMVPLGEGRTFVVEGRTIAVFRQRDGSVYATQPDCPHLGGPLAEGLIGDGVVLCPLHSYKFDLKTGACATDPACRINTYPIRAEAGKLYVSL